MCSGQIPAPSMINVKECRHEMTFKQTIFINLKTVKAARRSPWESICRHLCLSCWRSGGYGERFGNVLSTTAPNVPLCQLSKMHHRSSQKKAENLWLCENVWHALKAGNICTVRSKQPHGQVPFFQHITKVCFTHIFAAVNLQFR